MTTELARTRGGRIRLRPLIVAGIMLLVVIYATNLAWLFIGATEGDVPDRAYLPVVPSEARVLSEDQACGSGGCWREVVLAPGEGQSPTELAERMGVADRVRIKGNLLDPRTIRVESHERNGRLIVVLRYWG